MAQVVNTHTPSFLPCPVIFFFFFLINNLRNKNTQDIDILFEMNMIFIFFFKKISSHFSTKKSEERKTGGKKRENKSKMTSIFHKSVWACMYFIVLQSKNKTFAIQKRPKGKEKEKHYELMEKKYTHLSVLHVTFIVCIQYCAMETLRKKEKK